MDDRISRINTFSYSERLRAHLSTSASVGRMANPDGVGVSGAAECGDTVRMEVCVEDGRVTRALFQAYGCPAALGAAAELARAAEGALLLQTLSRGVGDVAEHLGLPRQKWSCAAVAVDALHSAIEDAVRRDRGILNGAVSSGSRGVLVAMSGGVDSSVAALRLQEQGYQVVGVTFRLWSDPACATGGLGCCSPETITRAREVAHALGLPHLTVDFRAEFRAKVVGDFIDEYARARTPNPCVRCNNDFRFTALADLADRMGLEWMATGHYAQVGHSPLRLRRGVDENKDQSYVLAGTDQSLLRRCLFPLGGQTKEETRAQARSAGLATQDSPESQEICFIPDDDYRRFLRSRLGESPGLIVDTEGRPLGEHEGLYNFTLGQRRGLGVSAPHPLYVVALRAEEGEVVVGSAEEARIGTVRLEDVVGYADGVLPESGYAQLRSNSGPVEVRICSEGEEVVLELREEVSGVAPGQAAVIYDHDEVVAAGTVRGVDG